MIGKRKSRLTIVSPIFPPDIGGPASYTNELCHRLSEDFDLNAIVFCGGEVVSVKNVEVVAINPHHYGFFGRQLRLWKNLKKYAKKSDTIYVQGPVVVGFTTTLFAKWSRIKTVLKFVGDIAWEDASRRGKTDLNLDDWLMSSGKDLKSRLLQWVQRESFKNADRLVVPSNYLKKILMSFYSVSESKIEMIYNAFDSKAGTRKQDQMVLSLMCAGRLERHKNMDLIIQAMKFLPENYTLDIYGDGTEKENLIKSANQFGERIRFHGNVSHEKMVEAMEKHGIFILYSSYEGLPHVILEAFSVRCPVVASNIQGTDEVAINGKTATLVAPKNPEKLAEAIQDLAGDINRREQFSQNGVNLLKAEFSWEIHIEKLKKIV